jgi:hypothetical protein
MVLKAASITARQSSLKVVGDHLDGLLANDVLAAQRQHRQSFFT